MAIFRQSPKCLKCGDPIDGKYTDQSKIPPMQQLIGDTFEGWDYEGHVCNQNPKPIDIFDFSKMTKEEKKRFNKAAKGLEKLLGKKSKKNV